MEDLMRKLHEAADFVSSRIGADPVGIGMILGSGLGELANEVEDRVVVPYQEIPYFPVSTVPGHAGQLVVGRMGGRRVLVMQGRFHFYEGYPMDTVVFPVRMMRVLGIENLLVTNAAGCVNTAWNPGDLMIISDHIKLIAENPLRGANPSELGERFFRYGDSVSGGVEGSRPAVWQETGDSLEGGGVSIVHRSFVRDSCGGAFRPHLWCRCRGHVHCA